MMIEVLKDLTPDLFHSCLYTASDPICLILLRGAHPLGITKY